MVSEINLWHKFYMEKDPYPEKRFQWNKNESGRKWSMLSEKKFLNELA